MDRLSPLGVAFMSPRHNIDLTDARRCRIDRLYRYATGCAELSNVEGSATPLRLRTPAIGLMAAYGSRGNAPTLKNYALPSDVEAKSLECDDYA